MLRYTFWIKQSKFNEQYKFELNQIRALQVFQAKSYSTEHAPYKFLRVIFSISTETEW